MKGDLRRWLRGAVIGVVAVVPVAAFPLVLAGKLMTMAIPRLVGHG
jgi:hypothetical protein